MSPKAKLTFSPRRVCNLAKSYCSKLFFLHMCAYVVAVEMNKSIRFISSFVYENCTYILCTYMYMHKANSSYFFVWLIGFDRLNSTLFSFFAQIYPAGNRQKVVYCTMYRRSILDAVSHQTEPDFIDIHSRVPRTLSRLDRKRQKACR